MYDLCNILKHVVYSLNDVSLSEHHLVVERHELVLHVRPESCNQMYAILKQEIKQLLGDVPLVSEQLAIQAFSKHPKHFRILVADIGPGKYKRYYLPTIIAYKMQFETMAPPHGSFAISGNSLEHLVCISAQVVTNGYHRGINEADTRTSSKTLEIQEEHQLKENSALQFHEAVVRYC